jgi:PPP family 3-phenylpropionic acid transporter
MSARDALVRFGLLFSVLYVSFGAASPFFPAFLSSRGLTADQIGLALGLGSACRLAAGPIAGRLADRLHALRSVLASCCALAALVACAFLMTHGFSLLLLLGLCYAAMLAPTTSLADALALRAASGGVSDSARESASNPGLPEEVKFEYGWVRGAGSAAFIVGSIIAGQAIDVTGPAAGLGLQAIFLIVAAFAALLVPELASPRAALPSAANAGRGTGGLLRIREFRLVVLLAALILGSHAMHDSFVMILWKGVGIGAGLGSVLWAESVAAEVLVFFWLGPWLLRHVRPEAGMGLAALATVLRWTLTAHVSSPAAFAFLEPLHGLTFALLHLACMRVLVAVVPDAMAATAQTLYALGIGAASAALTLLSGWLYSRFGPGGFVAMAGLAALSLPVIALLWRTRTMAPRLSSRQHARANPN